LLDRKRILPCAAYLEGEYGIRGYFMGVPVQIGAGGVEKVIELPLSPEEKAEMEKSFQSVKRTVEGVKI
jgi:malate dehydrogenase